VVSLGDDSDGKEGKWDCERRKRTGSWRRGKPRVGDELMCCSIYPVC
jgi:hypothetical protein